jgi:S-adenosylmethionine:tRNA ribosyltransferase-isomerase
MSELDQYDYRVPRELIAQHPLRKRSDARLMVVHRGSGQIEHTHIRQLPEFLRASDCLVFNDTKVIPARLVGRRDRTNARWTGLFLGADEHGVWQILSKTRGKLEPGEAIVVLSWDVRQSITLRLLTKLEGGVWAVRPEPMGEALEILSRVGRVPLPPYIRDGEMIEEDIETYQTVYAERPGAVAAPTAGLHFTPELLGELSRRGVEQQRVTLHVGIGTFRPITAGRAPDAQRMVHTYCRGGREADGGQESRQEDRGRGNDRGAGVGNGGRQRRDSPVHGPDRAVHSAAIYISRVRCAAHQFSFAAQHALDPGEDIWRQRADAAGV